MNHAYVIDASVAVKWLIREELSDKACDLHDDSRRLRRPLYAPPNLMNEVANAIYQRYRRRNITYAEADQLLQQFYSYPPVQIVTLPGLYQSAVVFARDHQLSDIYDSLYVVLADMLNLELCTADERLNSSTSSVAPWIRWIGDYTSA